MTRRWLRMGLVLAATYAVVVAGTARLSPQLVRPLFDGAGNVVPYRWVKPPFYAGTYNVAPRPNRTEVGFRGGKSKLTGVTSEDSQVVLNLSEGGFPNRPGDTKVVVAITPLDPEELGAVPGSDRPNGNTYRVEMTYEPSGRPVDSATIPGNIVMIVPLPNVTLLYADDGRGWEKVPIQLLGDATTVGASFTRAGYYLATTDLPPVPNPTPASSQTRPVLLVVTLVVALALVLGLAPIRPGRRRPNPRGSKSGPKGRAGPAKPSRRVRRVKR